LIEEKKKNTLTLDQRLLEIEKGDKNIGGDKKI
jgi:hypothetical protein